MKTLNEIVTAVRDGERPDYDDLRYALCAMDALSTFDRGAFMRLAQAEREGKKPFLVTSAVWQWEEHFRRQKTAGAKPPKEYVGWNNDPDNLEFLKRRKASKRLMDSMIERAADPTEVATCDACDRVRHQWQRECADTDSLLQTLGLCPSEYRSDGGSLLLGRISHKLASIAAAKPEAK